jgi:hypothetical protein
MIEMNMTKSIMKQIKRIKRRQEIPTPQPHYQHPSPSFFSPSSFFSPPPPPSYVLLPFPPFPISLPFTGPFNPRPETSIIS